VPTAESRRGSPTASPPRNLPRVDLPAWSDEGRLRSWIVSADWDYAQLSRIASQGGGPQAYLDAIKQGSREQGRFEGGIAGVVLTVACGAVAYFGPKAYHSIRSLNAKKRAASAAEVALLENDSPPESDDNDVPPDCV